MSERLIEVLAYSSWLNTLTGNPAPRIKELHDRMSSPQVGDLVLETSTIYFEDRVGTRLGKLTRIALEPMYAPEDWNEQEEGRPIPTEKIWYIELPDGREYRWNNASFIAVPTDLPHMDEGFVSNPSVFLKNPALSVSPKQNGGEK